MEQYIILIIIVLFPEFCLQWHETLEIQWDLWGTRTDQFYSVAAGSVNSIMLSS